MGHIFRTMRRGQAPAGNGRWQLPVILLAVAVSIAFLFSFLGSSVDAAMPLAGTTITNQALASYTDAGTGFAAILYSNKVELVIQPLEALTLTTSQSIFSPIGAPISIPHRLTNTGNVLTSYTITFANVGISGDNFDILSLSLALDLNGNGVAESVEPVITNNSTVTIAPGNWLDLVITGIVPVGASVSQSGKLSVTAVSTVQHVSATNTDTITVSSNAVLNVRKSVSNPSPLRNEDVNFTISTTNTGNAAAAGIGVVVDGNPLSLVILRDTIPANTTFVAFTGSSSGTRLYHKVGDALHTYSTTPPLSLLEVDAVAVGFSSLGSNVTVPMSFTVRINENADGNIYNTATAYFNDGVVNTTSDSNTVIISLAELPPVIHYYRNSTFSDIAGVTTLGIPLYIQADAAACNTNSAVSETHEITVSSSLTGDIETYIGTETGPNTGVFRILTGAPVLPLEEWVPTRNGRINPIVRGNGIIEALTNDTLSALLSGCSKSSVSAVIMIDPYGVVFNSMTNEPVSGAIVSLIDVDGRGNEGDAGGLAFVFDFDGERLDSVITTGPDGHFQFPLVLPSSYRLMVTAPNGFSFPSIVPAGFLPHGRTIAVPGSYGGNFPVNAATGTVKIDVPLDPGPASGLFIEKTGSRRVAEIGDFIDYAIKVKNTSGREEKDIRITDDLPAGFSYQRGTARLGGSNITDPEGIAGPRLIFRLGNLADGATAVLTYRIKVGTGAMQGDGVNSAVATTFYKTVSNTAAWKVELQGGVFSDTAYIIGKIFTDCNTNRVQDEAELGIPGVRIFLEDGTFVITDEEGKFSFYGISPRTHMLKVDNTTLPEGSRLEVISNRNALDAGSRFVDLKKGELHKADFAEVSCSEHVMKQVTHRRSQKELFKAEADRNLENKLVLETTSLSLSDRRALSASGVIGTDARIPSFSSILPDKSPEQMDYTLPPDPRVKSPMLELEKILPDMDNKLDFIYLKDNATLAYSQINVGVKGTAGGVISLSVNNEEIPYSRIGQNALLSEKQLEAWEYIGVDLKPGSNDLMVTQSDQFGNLRGSKLIKVIAPGNIAKIIIKTADKDLQADGRTPVAINISLTDDNGVPVTVRTQLTLEASAGRWKVEDLDSTERGVQVFIEGGNAEYILEAPSQPGASFIKISSGIIKAEKEIYFLPELRPMIGAGLVEGVLNLSKLNPKKLVPVSRQDGFEDEIREIAFSSDNGTIQGGARAALFLKGKVKGDYLLTLAYDSEKDTKVRLFRDIQPDEYYPVYGDSSIRGFDAQSTGRLYVRIDKDKSYLFYGEWGIHLTQQYTTYSILGYERVSAKPYGI